MDITYYINTDSTPGGDGTTNDIVGVSRAWASITEAYSSLTVLHSDLIQEDVNIYVRITGSTVDSSWSFNNNFIMDATHALHFIVEESSFHNFIKDTGYRCGQIDINADAQYLFLDGFAITGGSTAGIKGQNNNPNADRCFCYNNLFGVQGSGNYFQCMFIDNTSRGAYANSDGGSITLKNCTSIGNGSNGIAQSVGTLIATDCYSGGNSNADYNGVQLNNCASSDTTGTTGLINITLEQAFSDPTNKNYTPIALGPLDDTGSDGSNIGAIQLDVVVEIINEINLLAIELQLDIDDINLLIIQNLLYFMSNGFNRGFNGGLNSGFN